MSSDSKPESEAAVLATALRAITLVLAFGSSVLIARVLKPEGRGAYFVIMTVAVAAMSLGHLSLEQAHVYLWSKVGVRQSLVANSVVLGLGLGCIAGIAAWTIVYVVGPDVFPVAGLGVLGLAMIAVPLGIVTTYMSGFLVLDRRLLRLNGARLIAACFQLVVLGLMALSGKLNVLNAIVVWVIFLALPLAAARGRFRANPRYLSKPLAREAIALGARYHLGMSAVFLLLRADLFLLNSMTTAAQVGLYSLAVTIAELTYLVTDSVAQIMLPRQLAETLETSGQITARIVRINVVLAFVILVVTISLGPFFIPRVFGEEFAGSTRAIVALAPGILALATMRAVGGFLIRLNRPLVVSSVSIAAMASNVALNLFLIPRFGIVGAGLASSVVYVLLATFYLIWLRKAGSLQFGDLVPRVSDIRDPLIGLMSGILNRRGR